MNLEKMQELCRAFGIAEPLTAVEEIQVGHINKTYKVCCGKDAYLLQALNTYVFRQPEQLMENIAKVTTHIEKKNPKGCNLRFLCTKDGRNYVRKEDGFWRMCNYIPSLCCDMGKDLAVVAQAAEAFGQFQLWLTDFDASQLTETIADFHNTKRRYEALVDAVKKDCCHRVQNVQQELHWLMEQRELACTLTELQEQGKLPLRVTHNDTKINNVLFDLNSRKALCVIDLDTVMPGLVGHDFGDAIRTAANSTGEDDACAENAVVDLQVFRAFSRAFVNKVGGSLCKEELDTLALSAFCLTVEQTVRFLTDYLQGDVYFHINYEEHNLQRTRCQLHLAQDMLEHMEEMKEIIREVSNERALI